MDIDSSTTMLVKDFMKLFLAKGEFSNHNVKLIYGGKILDPNKKIGGYIQKDVVIQGFVS